MARKQDLRGTSVDLARLLGITDRRVRQLVNDGIVSRQPEGDYLLPEAIAEYYAFKYKPDEAEYLNDQGVVTALNFIGGWKCWGNRTACYPSNTDEKDAFISIRRMFYLQRRLA